MKNLALRIFSIAVAIVLWYFVNSDGNLTMMGFSAPIEIRDLPDNKILTSQSHKLAHVTVRGPAFLVSKLAAVPPVVRIKLPKETENRYLAPLPKSELDLPPSVQIISIEPPEVKFAFDKLVKKKVPVVVPRIGALGDSYIVRDLKISPSEIEISGPEGELLTITNLETYPLDFSTAKSDFTRTLNIRLPGPLVEVEDNQVTATVNIDLVILERQFQQVPVVVKSSDSSQKWKANPSHVLVDVSGAREAVKVLTVTGIEAYVDSDSLVEGKVVSVEVKLPEGIELHKVQPAQVKVTKALSTPVAKAKR